MKTYIKKAAALLVILAAVLTAMPQTVRAGDEYGFEILVEPSPAPIGGEVTLTVRLTDYDETKAGIRGFQIYVLSAGAGSCAAPLHEMDRHNGPIAEGSPAGRSPHR